jgi:hypothetical protein
MFRHAVIEANGAGTTVIDNGNPPLNPDEF